MRTRPALRLQIGQKLVLTPQLYQALQRLQCPVSQLEAELRQELAENPLLERIDPLASVCAADQAPYLHETADRAGAAPGVAPDHSALPEFPDEVWGPPSSGSATRFGQEAAAASYEFEAEAQAGSLQDYLREQVRMAALSERQQLLVCLLADELDDNGYMTDSLSAVVASIVGALPQLAATSDAEWKGALDRLQSLDPAGVGARTVSECLLLQLARCQAPAEVLQCARTLASAHLSDLAKAKYARLKKRLGCDAAVFEQARHLLMSLDPKPGRPYALTQAMPALPEISVRNTGAAWQAFLNPLVVPRLRLRATGLSLQGADMAASDAPGGRLSGQTHLQAARTFIKHIYGRYATLLQVARFIVAHQQAVFSSGDERMRPLTLRQIAAATGLHVSTVSRATRHKYMETPQGVFELRRYLSNAVAFDGERAVSAAAIRASIRSWVAAEAQDVPLSDQQIVNRLADELGVHVARRTVAKYRQHDGIPCAWHRKR